MNYEDYNKVVKDFKGLRIYNAGEPNFYSSHYKLISNFIETADVLRKCFEKHSDQNDYFPSHIDLKKALNEILNISQNTKHIDLAATLKQVENKKFTRIYNDSGTHYAKIENEMSNEMWQLESALVNKELVLVACKKDLKYCAKKKQEMEIIKEKIKELKIKEAIQ